jgi:hypothetical protein
MSDTAIAAADQLLGELATSPRTPPAETMGRLKKVSYTHKALIDLIIEHPEMTQNQLAAHFGYSPAWISNILASDAFQNAMAGRREEIIDPAIKATIEERFRALVIRSLAVLEEKLAKPAVSDQVAIRCAELGAKALGVGGHAPPPAPKETAAERLERLATRLLELQPQGRVINGEAEVVARDSEPRPAAASGVGGFHSDEVRGSQPHGG